MTFRFGLYSFETTKLELLRQGSPLALENQPARALALLLSRAGEVVTREELRQAVWDSGTHVDFERGLAYVFSQIRSTLQDTASNPRFLQTLPRQGYKFIAPVEREVCKPASPLRRRLTIGGLAASAALGVLGYLLVPRTERLAVSIFDNETGRADLDGWVHSLNDVVVSTLTDLDPRRLAVIGNSATLRRPRNIRNLKSLAKELSADYILLGQLQNQGERLRFVTHLIRLPGETHLKANRLFGDAVHLGELETAVVGEYVRMVREQVLK